MLEGGRDKAVDVADELASVLGVEASQGQEVEAEAVVLEQVAEVEWEGSKGRMEDTVELREPNAQVEVGMGAAE